MPLGRIKSHTRLSRREKQALADCLASESGWALSIRLKAEREGIAIETAKQWQGGLRGRAQSRRKRFAPNVHRQYSKTFARSYYSASWQFQTEAMRRKDLDDLAEFEKMIGYKIGPVPIEMPSAKTKRDTPDQLAKRQKRFIRALGELLDDNP
jgi:hypothetical protein